MWFLNRWNTDQITGQSCVGCGDQELFLGKLTFSFKFDKWYLDDFYKGCSDITILPSGTTSPSTTENNSKPTPTDGPVQIYGKCGGIGYTGQIECNQGLTCFKQSDFYSQCLPGSCPLFWACQKSREIWFDFLFN
jgi:hypothetical protein